MTALGYFIAHMKIVCNKHRRGDTPVHVLGHARGV